MASKKMDVYRWHPVGAMDVDAILAGDRRAGASGEPVDSLGQPANELIERFGRAPGVTPQQVRGLKVLLIGSPALAMQFDKAANAGVVRHIELLAESESEGDRISGDGVMYLSPGVLSFNRESWADFFRPIGHLAGTLARGLDAQKLRRDLARSQEKFAKVALSGNAVHDYTGAVRDYISAYRRYETRADIASANAKVSAAHADLGKPSRLPPKAGKEGFASRFLHAIRDYFKFCLGKTRPEVRVDKHDYIAASNENIAGVAKHSFDSAKSYGYGHNSDLANYHGTHAISYAAQCELYSQTHAGSKHRMRIDMANLGLAEDVVRANGINLNGYADSIAYVDKSARARKDASFPHTVRLCQRHHPDHALYRGVLADLKQLDAGCPPAGLRNLAAALVVDAREKGMSRIDRIYIEDGKAFVAQSPDKPWRTVAGGSIQEKAGTSIEDSSRYWAAAARKYNALRSSSAEQPFSPIQAPHQRLRRRGL